MNLSGGQKQRVALARAVYSKSDIYIIDDCLAALDAHIETKVFEQVILKELNGMTVVLITNAMHLTKHADRVIVMKGGRVHEQGTVAQLEADELSEYNHLNPKHANSDASEAKDELKSKLKISF